MPGESTEQDELTALRRENAMLRETLDAIDGGVVVYDADAIYRFGNAGYHTVFPHLPPDQELAGLPYEEILALSIAARSVADASAYVDPEAFKQRRRAEILDRTAAPAREIHHPVLDRWSQLRVKWTSSGNRVALRIDITELKRLQQELLRAQRMETIGRISRGVAHDFNGLLTVIVSNLEMIGLYARDPARVASLADTALRAAESGARLIRQLLTFARRDVTRPLVLDPNALLAGMDDLLRRTVGPGIDFAIEPCAGAGQAYFDASQFEGAIANLALNAREAIKAAGRAAGRITIKTARAAAADGNFVAVSVADTGCGMPPEVAAQAFEPFFTTKPAGSAPGLGLSQVYGFATGAGGQVRIDSEVDRGTTVTMLLPLAE